MTVAFPAGTGGGMSPYYSYTMPDARCGIYYDLTAAPYIQIHYTGQPYSPDGCLLNGTYEVRNWEGTVVTSGTVVPLNVTLQYPPDPLTARNHLNLTPPAGGWPGYGWYRLYLYDLTGMSAGALNFCIIRPNANFAANPANVFPINNQNSTVSGGSIGTESLDEVVHALFALGPQRFTINDIFNPSVEIAQTLANIAIENTYGNSDPHRPSERFVGFSSGAVDYLEITTATAGAVGKIYCKDGTIDGSQITVTIEAASVSGFKFIVLYSGTPVETYDNMGNGPANDVNRDLYEALLSSSAYIFPGMFFSQPIGLVTGAGPIGNTHFTAVTAAVSALYPAVEFYEGANEPNWQTPQSAREIVQTLMLLRASVKAANAGAKVIGPAAVTAAIGNQIDYADFFTAVAELTQAGNPPLDAFSFHAYGMEMGDLSQMRTNLGALRTQFNNNGLSTLPMWQTEQGVFTPVYGVYHPRRARWSMLQILVQESYGIPKEHSYYFYDTSHGFWGQPSWWENGNTGLNPWAPMMRTFSEEVYAKPFFADISYGPIGDRMYFGGVWKNPSDGTSVAIFMAPSPIDGGSVTLTVTGTTSALTVVDVWGNTSTVTPLGGRITLTVPDTPVYLELPNGVSVTPYTINGWTQALFTNQESLCLTRKQASPAKVANGYWENGYDDEANQPYSSIAPDTGTYITFKNPQRFDRIIIWCGMVWQAAGTLTDFDIEVSNDGTTWTVIKTITHLPPATIDFVTDYNEIGCTVETYWDERWIFDVGLDSPVVANYIRLNTRSCSYGGAPDLLCATIGDQASGSPLYAIEEIAVFCGASPEVLFPVRMGAGQGIGTGPLFVFDAQERPLTFAATTRSVRSKARARSLTFAAPNP